MKKTVLFLVVFLVAGAGCAPRTTRKYPIKVVCFIGKIDSRSSCSGTSSGDYPDGKMTCGLIGQVSEIQWSYQGSDFGADVYQFSRKFPLEGKSSTFVTKKIEFSGKRVIVFEDRYQVIVVDPDPALKK